jgi:hypothetical protein
MLMATFPPAFSGAARAGWRYTARAAMNRPPYDKTQIEAISELLNRK